MAVACAAASLTVSLAVAAEHTLPLLPAASKEGPQGFVRVINRSDIPGEVVIDAFDDTGRWYGPVLLAVRADATVHFNSEDLERGNPEKGLSSGTGPGAGDWRLHLASALDIEVLAYVRSPGGFLTAMNSVAPHRGRFHRAPIFNPGSNRRQQSLLRLINPGAAMAEAAITGLDDSGDSPGGPVRVSLPVGASRTIWADELETGGPGLDGALGDGVGKWRLTIEASRPIVAMSLLMSPPVHVTNLSAAPHRGRTVVPAEGRFRDALAGGGEGPQMVVIRAGTYAMGCQKGATCRADELPVHDVTFPRRFAVSTHEITFEQWQACVDGGGCNGYRPDDAGWGRDDRPVIHVDWDDVRAYLSWLSHGTGMTYRLPSEAEWEYVARAGAMTTYSWGNAIGPDLANCREDDCADGFPNTAPVGSFPGNRWGLHDVHGNVAEWVQDCHNNARSYRDAPTDGSAWEFPHCTRRVLRGGSWENSARYVQAANRGQDLADARKNTIGFRVARTLVYPGGPGVAPLVPLASDRGPQGFVRVINHSDRAGTVDIDVFDDAGQAFGPLALSIGAREARHFNSDDLENGNPDKGLSGSTGPGTSAWRMEFSSDLDLEVLTYMRTPDGFLTAMQDLAPAAGDRHRIVIFNPGSNRDQESTLRLTNPGGKTAQVVIGGVDDLGRAGGRVRVSIPARASRSFTAERLESGGGGLRGALGDGTGKWRLSVDSDEPIMAMSLLASPTGHLTNLSAAPQRGDAPDVFERELSGGVDYDGDGLANRLDPDDDNDGVLDARDAFPGNAAEWADTNANGRGDNGEFLLSGRAPPAGPDPVEIDGRVVLGGDALQGGRVELTAINGALIARAETSPQGAFSVTLSASLLPDWFVINASGGEVRRTGEDRQEEAGVPNLGALRAYVGKHHPAAGPIRVGPWTEIAYQEVRLRFPSHQGLPDGLSAESILDGISATFPDRGSYEQLLRYGSMTVAEGTPTALRKGIVDPLLAGAPPSEVADRASAFRAQYGRAGIVSERYASRRVARVRDTRILTAFSRDLGDRVARVRQSYLDRTGALVDTRLSLLNPDDSAVRIDVRHAGGQGLAVSGRSAGLEGLRWRESVMEDFEDWLILVGAGDSAGALSVDIDKSIAEAISDGRLLFRVDGRPPGSDELSIVRDDPIVAWTPGDSTATPLDDDGVHRVVDGVPVRILSNEDVLVLQFFRETDRDRFGGVAGASARKALYLWLVEEGAAGRLAHMSGQPWIPVLAAMYGTHGRIRHVGSAVGYREALRGSSRVHVNRRVAQADDRIRRGQEYGLDFFFDHAVTWENARGDIVPCAQYSDGDIRRAVQDPAFRKRPSGATGDRPCRADIRLQIEQQDAIVYGVDAPSTPDESFVSLMTACAAAGYDSIGRRPAPEEGGYHCHRWDVERSSTSLGTLGDLEHGFYWVMPRQPVALRPRADLRRLEEVVVGATMRLALADDRGLFARAVRYDVDPVQRDLYPEFEVWSDGTTLVLDARASVVDPEVPEASVEYAWSYFEKETAAWQHTASAPLHEVPLAELGLTGEATYIRIRLEITAQGQNESVTKVVRIDPDAWNRGVFNRL